MEEKKENKTEKNVEKKLVDENVKRVSDVVSNDDTAFPDLNVVKTSDLEGVELLFLDFVERQGDDGKFLVAKAKRTQPRDENDVGGEFVLLIGGIPRKKIMECKEKGVWPVKGTLSKKQSKTNKTRSYWDLE